MDNSDVERNEEELTSQVHGQVNVTNVQGNQVVQRGDVINIENAHFHSDRLSMNRESSDLSSLSQSTQTEHEAEQKIRDDVEKLSKSDLRRHAADYSIKITHFPELGELKEELIRKKIEGGKSTNSTSGDNEKERNFLKEVGNMSKVEFRKSLNKYNIDLQKFREKGDLKEELARCMKVEYGKNVVLRKRKSATTRGISHKRQYITVGELNESSTEPLRVVLKTLRPPKETNRKEPKYNATKNFYMLFRDKEYKSSIDCRHFGEPSQTDRIYSQFEKKEGYEFELEKYEVLDKTEEDKDYVHGKSQYRLKTKDGLFVREIGPVGDGSV